MGNLDLVLVLQKRIASLPKGAHVAGLRAVVTHITSAIGHLSRGTEGEEETAFTDVIYRCNQAFEGSLKEAYRVLASKDPLSVTPFKIETFLQEQNLLRPRVTAQVATYRTQWRNPSTHDYTLDFDEDEALLAILSVCGFAVVLVDQIAERLSFDAAKADTTTPAAPVKADVPLVDYVADAITTSGLFDKARVGELGRTEVEITGALMGYLSTIIPGASLSAGELLGDRRGRADIVVRCDDRELLLEVKRRRSLHKDDRNAYVDQMSRYILASGIKNALIYVHADGLDAKWEREEIPLPNVDGRLVMLTRRVELPR